jgi:hypothetical protein
MSYAICLKNNDYPASLEPRKLYEVIPDAASEGRGFIRVIDESGEDYLYPSGMFAVISIPAGIEAELKAA